MRNDNQRAAPIRPCGKEDSPLPWPQPIPGSHAIITSQVLIFALIYGLAGFTQGMVGFGFALISVTTVSLLTDPVTAVANNAILGSFNCAWNLFVLRRSVAWKRSLPFTLLGLSVMPLGALFLFNLPRDVIIRVLGATVILLTIFPLIMPKITAKYLTGKPAAAFFALTAGLLGGAFSTPGPPVVTYYYASEKDPRIAKANIQLFFVGVSIVLIVMQTAAGNLTLSRFLYLLPLIPVVWLTTTLGLAAAGRLPGKLFAAMVNTALVGLGIYLLVSG